ncbi:MAG: hypothetical protein AAFV53_25805 [Myxococcota bacterium]
MSVNERQILQCGDSERAGIPSLVRSCEQTWADLSETGEERVRYCQACDHFVHRVANVVEARVRARQGECLAVPVEIYASVQRRAAERSANDGRIIVGMFDPNDAIDELLQE